MENLIVFINYTTHIPITIGMFGKENLEYISTYNQRDFDNSKEQIFYHKKLNTKIYIFNHINDFLNKPDEFYNSFDKKIIFLDNLFHKGLSILQNKKFDKINNVKKGFIWHYAEVFEDEFIEKLKEYKYDYILSASERPELENNPNFYLDRLFSFRYFRFYIGFSYLESLISKIDTPKYNKNIPKLFSYIRQRNDNAWRSKFLELVPEISNLLESKNSANDAYDLLFPKLKHFEAINDYLYCNFNLIFETLDYNNNTECFITEKTYKGLFYGKPFFLITSFKSINHLKKCGFYIANFEFLPNIQTPQDVVRSIKLFSNWINSASEEEIEIRYNEMLEKSLNNRSVLMNYLNDYSVYENTFQKMLNGEIINDKNVI